MFETALAAAVSERTLNNTVSFGTVNISLLLTAEQTGGSFSLLETIMRPGTEPPYHIHDREDETFYVIEGHVSVMVDGIVHECHSGQTIFLPRGLPHTFKVRSEVARLLNYLTPAGFERYFEAVGEPALSLDKPTAGTRPANHAEVAGRAAALYGVRFAEHQPRF